MSGILMASVGNSYGSAPVNTVAPAVTGTATVGQTLSTTNGTWTGAPAPTFTYQWQRSAVNISGATSSTYVLVAADYANTIRCVVTATNSVAPSGVSANSNSTASVAGNAPVNTVAPVVSGTATFGQTLSTTNGTWTGVPTPTFTYQWQRVTTNISGATSSTYVLVAADVGNTIRCVVTGTNAVSAVSANSNSTASVAATVPGAPTIGAATATGSTTATVAYTAPASNGGATITLYTATSSPGGLTGTLATAGSGTITVTGLTAVTSYTFTVKATNSVGQSAASAASNSITTSAASWITLIGGAAPYALSSSTNFAGNGATTWLSAEANTNPPKTMNFRLSATGSLSSSTAYTTDKVAFIAQHSSGDMYITGSNDSYPLAKLNSSGTQQWGKNFVGSFLTFPTAAINSANTFVYYAGVGRESGDSTLAFMKFNASTGAYVWQKRFSRDVTLNGSNCGSGLDSSDNYYFSARRDDTSRAVLAKYDSSGNKVFLLISSDASLSYTSFKIKQVTSAGNCYGFSTWNSTASFLKFNSSGSIVWQRSVTNQSFVTEAVGIDSSENVYFGFTRPIAGVGRSYIFKYNSSGTLQWQRSFYSSAGTTNIQAIDASNTGIIKVRFSLPNSSLVIVAQLPNDGTLTGTYGNYTYEVSTETETAGGTSNFGTLNVNAVDTTLAFTDYTWATTTPPTYPLTTTSVP